MNIISYISLNFIQLMGMGLGYVIIVFLSRTQGLDALGTYLFQLNSVIILGTASAMGMSTIVQRLGAELDASNIGSAMWLTLRGQWLTVASISVVGSGVLLSLKEGPLLNFISVGELALSALFFGLFLLLQEAIRISRGAIWAEFLRNLVRQALILFFLWANLDSGAAIIAAVFVTLLVAFAVDTRNLPNRRSSGREDHTELENYVSSSSSDRFALFALCVTGLLVSSIDIFVFGLLNSADETGLYGAASRFAMIVNVALLASNAQIVAQVAKVAKSGTADLAPLQRQVKMLRLTATAFLIGLFITFPLYAHILQIPMSDLWVYFVLAAFSFWVQAMFGPVEMLIAHTHQVTRLIVYNGAGFIVFLVSVWLLHLAGVSYSVPFGTMAAAITVKLLCWYRLRNFNSIKI